MGKKVKILAIIPARGGSKSIPHKNIALVNGKPLIYYTIREALKSKLVDATIVSTDDSKIAEVAESFGADVPFLRPAKYAQDYSRDIEFLKHAVWWVEKYRGWRPEIILFLQPTSPSRTWKDIDAVIRFMKKTRCDSVRTVFYPPGYPALKMLVVTQPKSMAIKSVLSLMPDFKKLGTDVPRQLLPKVVQPVGLVYATRTKFIKKGRVWGDDVRGFIVSPEKATDIDDPEDLLKAGLVLKKFKL